MISIIKSALATTDAPITLVYANRDADAVIFADELERLGARIGRSALGAPPPRLASAASSTPRSARRSSATTRDADFYICGPGPYMDTVEAGLATLGVDAGQVFIERFVLPERAPGRRRRRPPPSRS